MDGDELKRRFGRKVQALREAKGLTQEQLASLIGRSVDTLSNIERGVNATRIEIAYALAVELGVPMQTLFDLDDPSNEAVPEPQPGLAPILELLQGVEADTLGRLKELIEVGLRLAGHQRAG